MTRLAVARSNKRKLQCKSDVALVCFASVFKVAELVVLLRQNHICRISTHQPLFPSRLIPNQARLVNDWTTLAYIRLRCSDCQCNKSNDVGTDGKGAS